MTNPLSVRTSGRIFFFKKNRVRQFKSVQTNISSIFSPLWRAFLFSDNFVVKIIRGLTIKVSFPIKSTLWSNETENDRMLGIGKQGRPYLLDIWFFLCRVLPVLSEKGPQRFQGFL